MEKEDRKCPLCGRKKYITKIEGDYTIEPISHKNCKGTSIQKRKIKKIGAKTK